MVTASASGSGASTFLGNEDIEASSPRDGGKAGLLVAVVMVYMHILEAYKDGAEIDCVM